MTKKIGLALSSGGARGLAHIGVLKVLEENKVPIHEIAGASIGALVGAIYAGNPQIRPLQEFAESFDKKKSRQIFDWEIPRRGLIKGDRIRGLLKPLLKKDFSEFKLPLSVVVTDLTNGTEIIVEKGNPIDAIMASISIPVLFEPVIENDRIFVDGGVLNPLPINVLEKKGCDVIIAVDVEYRTLWKTYRPTIVRIAVNSILLMKQQIVENIKQDAKKKPNIIIIEPDIEEGLYLDFSAGKTLISIGEEATKKCLPKILQLVKE
ncbi:MAG: patatin-like phospholipase family protein [Candidatus Woesearchaeota archaeon]